MAVQVIHQGLDCAKCSEQEKKNHGYYHPRISGRDLWVIDNEEFRVCPGKMVKRTSMEYIEAYAYFKHYNRFPVEVVGSGWQQQPAKLLKAFEVIETKLEEIRKEEEKQAAKAEQAAAQLSGRGF